MVLYRIRVGEHIYRTTTSVHVISVESFGARDAPRLPEASY